MKQFLGTLILVLLASFITGFVAELKEYTKKERTGIREFSTKENFGYAVIVYSVIAIIIWGICLSIKTFNT